MADLRGTFTVADLRQMVQEETHIRNVIIGRRPPDGIGGPGYVGEFVLAQGKEYQPGRWRGRRMMVNGCFRNATLTAFRAPDLYTYVEGYAVSGAMLESGFAMPMHHAWCVDAAGVVFDPTFKQPEHGVYLGVPISLELLEESTSRTGFYGMFYPGEMLNVEFFREYARTLTPAETVLP